MRGYFLMNLLYKGGTFDDVIDALDDFKKMGIKLLWLNPVHEQSTMHWKNPYVEEDLKADESLPPEKNPFAGARHDRQELNNHGYWVSDHRSVALRLGGPNKLKLLVSEARKRGIEICLDTVLNHFGYPADEDTTFNINGKQVHWSNTAYFRKIHLRTRHHQVPGWLYGALSNSDTEQKARSNQSELTQYSLENLICFNHDNPEVRKYLIDSYKYFYDEMGLRVFRIDAAKHYSQEFLAEFINAMNEHAAHHGEQITFIVEFLEYKDFVLDVFINDLVAKVKDSSLLFFLDFPVSRELRRLFRDDDGSSLSYAHLRGHMEYRDRVRPQARLIPMVEDHDLSAPIQDEFFDKMIYVTAEFFSYNPVVIFHGNEAAKAPHQARTHIESINPEGEVARYIQKVGEALAPYRSTRQFGTSHFHAATHSFGLIEKSRDAKHSIFLMSEKSGHPSRHSVVLPPHFMGRKLKYVVGGNGVELGLRAKEGSPEHLELHELADGGRVLAELRFERQPAGLALHIDSKDKFFAVFEMVSP